MPNNHILAEFRKGDKKTENVKILNLQIKKIHHENEDYYLPHDFLSEKGKQRRNVSKRLQTFFNREECANSKYIVFGKEKYINGQDLKMFLLENHWDLKQSIESEILKSFSSFLPESNAASAAQIEIEETSESDPIVSYMESLCTALASYDADRIERELKCDHEGSFKVIDPKLLHLEVGYKDIDNKKNPIMTRSNSIPHTARFQNLKKRQREKTREFFASVSAVSLVMGSNFWVNLCYLFKTHKYVFKYFLKDFVSNNAANLKFAKSIIFGEKDNMITAEKLLFVKDEIRMSDKKYARMYNFLGLQGVLPAPNLVATTRGQIDKISFEQFGFEVVRDGWVLQPKPLLEAAVSVLEDAHDISVKEREAAGEKGETHAAIEQLPNPTLVKSSEDGCEIDNKPHTFLGYQIVAPKVISPKNPLSWFFAGVLHVPETKDNLKENFSFFKEFNRLCESIKGHKEYTAFLIWVSDLGSLIKQCGNALDSSNPCFKCWFSTLLKKLFFFRYKFRELTTGLGFVTKKLFICVLHMFQRLTEKLIFYTSKGGDLSKKEILLEIFQENWELCNIKFVVDKKAEEEDEGVDPNNQNHREKVSMCTGNALNALLNKPQLLNRAFSDPLRESLIWKIFSKTWKFCHVSHTHYSNDNLRVLMGTNELLSYLIPKAYDLELGVPHYLHYFYHLPDFMIILRELGVSLSMIDQSGFELSNIVFDHIYHECICRKPPTYKKISEKYRTRLQKTNQFIYQDHLLLPRDNSQKEKKRYAQSFESLCTLLATTRRLTLSLKFKFPYLHLPNYKRKKAKNVKTVDVEEEIDMEEENDVSKEEEEEQHNENNEQEPVVAIHELLNSDNEDDDENETSNLVQEEGNAFSEENDGDEEQDDCMEEENEDDDGALSFNMAQMENLFQLPPVQEESEKEKKRKLEEERKNVFLARQQFLPEKEKVHPLLREFLQFAVSPQELQDYINNQTAEAYDDKDVQEFIAKLPTSLVSEEPKHAVQFMHPEVLETTSPIPEVLENSTNPRKRRRMECSDLIADGHSEDNEQNIVPFLAADYSVNNLTSQLLAQPQIGQTLPQIQGCNLALLQQITQAYGNQNTSAVFPNNDPQPGANSDVSSTLSNLFNNWMMNEAHHESSFDNESFPIAQYFSNHSFEDEDK